MGREARLNKEKQNMTRIIRFTSARAEKHFELLLTALLSAGDSKGSRTRDRIRKEARLLDAFDGISDPVTGVLDGMRALKPRESEETPWTLTIREEEHALLAEYLDTCPWTPRAARDAVATQDWWSAADKVE